MPTISDFNLQTPLTDPQGRLTTAGYGWLNGPSSGDALAIVQALQRSIYRPCDPVLLTDQKAVIAATAFQVTALADALYRVSWYAQVTTADGVSSTFTPTISWTSSGRILTASVGAITGDTLNTFQTGSALIQSDAGAPITYSSPYASNSDKKMRFKWALALEQVS